LSASNSIVNKGNKSAPSANDGLRWSTQP
jgi:hypothetical protein